MADVAPRRLIVKPQVGSDDPRRAVDFLALHSGLSKSAVKDAMNKGAVWLTPRRGPRKRLRRATTGLAPGDRVELYYDSALLGLAPGPAHCIDDRSDYSVWYKPAGMLAQGTEYGDHCSLLRVAEQRLARPCFAVHRLDREAFGLTLIAHRQGSAAALSRLFQQGRVDKRYRIEVRGCLDTPELRRGRIDIALDGKPAITEYEVETVDASRASSVLRVRLLTGRLHQIRRHFERLGYPVIGDPRYGRGNKSNQGLRLAAVTIRFVPPGSATPVQFQLPPRYLEF